MSNIRRIFVGSTTFLVTGMTSDACLQIVSAAISGFVGVRVVEADLIGGLVTVTADRPVNRAGLAAAIIQAGYTVLAV